MKAKTTIPVEVISTLERCLMDLYTHARLRKNLHMTRHEQMGLALQIQLLLQELKKGGKSRVERRRQRGCDHVFIDTNVCIKCGWSPKEE